MCYFSVQISVAGTRLAGKIAALVLGATVVQLWCNWMGGQTEKPTGVKGAAGLARSTQFGFG